MQKTPKTNEELVAAIQSGAKEYTVELWGQMLDLVKWKANRIMAALELQGNCRGVDFEDLIQTGFVAMMDAVYTYKPQNGAFSTWLMFYLQSAFAEITGYRTKRSREDPINTATSLDLPISDSPDAPLLHESIPDPYSLDAFDSAEDKIWQEQLHEALEDVLSELPAKSNKVLRLRYYQNQTLAEVGGAFNVGTEMARQLELKALRELKKPHNANRLRPFLDFNAYSGTGLSSFRATGMTVQERFLIRQEEHEHRKNNISI